MQHLYFYFHEHASKSKEKQAVICDWSDLITLVNLWKIEPYNSVDNSSILIKFDE